MEEYSPRPIKKSEINYRVKRPNQTGFSSPATHYDEPRIDLNEVLVSNSSSTFYVRVTDDSFGEFQIFKNDVLIVDKARIPEKNQLILATQDGKFAVFKMNQENEEFMLWGVITYIIKSTL